MEGTGRAIRVPGAATIDQTLYPRRTAEEVAAQLDLAGVRFPNPFVRGVRFSLATGLHVIAAHERRHLWQAWRVRREAERALPAATPLGREPPGAARD